MFKQIHQDVEKKSKEFYDVLRRYNYVTPTSYLELLSSFDTLLAYKRGEVATKKNRLKIGLDKIISTGELVEGMQKELEILAPQLVVKGKEVDEMMVVIVRSRRPAVLRCLHAIDARRLQERMSWVVSFSILRPFGPSRATATPRAGTSTPDLL